MKQEMRLETSFYRNGKFVGGSFAVFDGTEEDFRDVRESKAIDESIIEFMARRAGVRNYDISRSHFEIVNVLNEEASESAEE